MATRITRMAYIQQALKYAAMNYKEGPGNDNRFSRLLGRPPEFWCADFECGVAKELDPVHWTDLLPNTPSCLVAIREWQRRGQWHSGFSGINTGDIAYIGHGGGHHTFIVVSLAGNRVNTVEGNTSDDGSANGDGVYTRQRSLTTIFGYGRPQYAAITNFYRVARGDSWKTISIKFKVSLVKLRELNGSLDALKPGDEIRIR